MKFVAHLYNTNAGARAHTLTGLRPGQGPALLVEPAAALTAPPAQRPRLHVRAPPSVHWR